MSCVICFKYKDAMSWKDECCEVCGDLICSSCLDSNEVYKCNCVYPENTVYSCGKCRKKVFRKCLVCKKYKCKYYCSNRADKCGVCKATVCNLCYYKHRSKIGTRKIPRTFDTYLAWANVDLGYSNCEHGMLCGKCFKKPHMCPTTPLEGCTRQRDVIVNLRRGNRIRSKLKNKHRGRRKNEYYTYLKFEKNRQRIV